MPNAQMVVYGRYATVTCASMCVTGNILEASPFQNLSGRNCASTASSSRPCLPQRGATSLLHLLSCLRATWTGERILRFPASHRMRARHGRSPACLWDRRVSGRRRLRAKRGPCEKLGSRDCFCSIGLRAEMTALQGAVHKRTETTTSATSIRFRTDAHARTAPGRRPHPCRCDAPTTDDGAHRHERCVAHLGQTESARGRMTVRAHVSHCAHGLPWNPGASPVPLLWHMPRPYLGSGRVGLSAASWSSPAPP